MPITDGKRKLVGNRLVLPPVPQPKQPAGRPGPLEQVNQAAMRDKMRRAAVEGMLKQRQQARPVSAPAPKPAPTQPQSRGQQPGQRQLPGAPQVTMPTLPEKRLQPTMQGKTRNMLDFSGEIVPVTEQAKPIGQQIVQQTSPSPIKARGADLSRLQEFTPPGKSPAQLKQEQAQQPIKKLPGEAVDKKPEYEKTYEWKPEEYGLWSSMADWTAARWRDAEEKVAEAGKGEYVPWKMTPEQEKLPAYEQPKVVKGLGDIFHNIGQVPYVGKALTAGTQSFLFTLGLPAELTERTIGQTWSQMSNIREELGVGDGADPIKEQAFQAALGVTYSGPEAVRNAYQDALKLAEQGQLHGDNLISVQANHGVWWREAAGQMVLDPLNLLSGAAKAITQARNAKKTLNTAVKIYGTAGQAVDNTLDDFLKGTVEVATNSEVMAGWKKSFTRAGQADEAADVIERVLAYGAPRTKATQIHRSVEATQQVLQSALRISEQTTIQRMVKAGKALDTPEAAKELADNFQNVVVNYVRLASDNQDEIRSGAAALGKLGYGTIPLSRDGRRTAALMKEMITKADGEVGALTDIVKQAKEGGLTAEHVAAQWADKVAKTMNRMVETPVFERTLIQQGAKAVIKAQEPFNDMFSFMFMGASPGYAIRNVSDNLARTVVSGWSVIPWRGRVKDITKKVVKQSWGIGQAGKETGLPDMRKLASFMEGVQGQNLASQAYLDIIQRSTSKAWGEVTKLLPSDAPPELVQVVKNKFWGALNGEITDVQDIISDMKTVLGGQAAPVAAATGLPPVAKPPKLLEPWRTLPDNLTDSLRTTGSDVENTVTTILNKAKDPEDALAQLGKLQKSIAENAVNQAEKMASSGPTVGSLAGEVVGQLNQLSKIDAPKNIQQLVKDISGIEHWMLVQRTTIMRGIRESVAPGEYIRSLDEVETKFSGLVEGLRKRQLIGFTKLQAGEITEEAYAKGIYRLYSEAREVLYKVYKKLNRELEHTTPWVGSPEDLQSAILRDKLVREGYSSGYKSIELLGVDLEDAESLVLGPYGQDVDFRPAIHFYNKVSQLIGKKGVRSLNDLSNDDLLVAINKFREGRANPLTYDELYQQYTTWGNIPKEIPGGGLTAVPVENVAGKGYTPAQIKEIFGVQYNLNEAGEIIYEPLRTALNPNWQPLNPLPDAPPFNALGFRKKGNTILTSRGSSHAPGDMVFTGNMDEAGKLTLHLETDEMEAVADYAETMLREGVPANTPVTMASALVDDTSPALLKKENLTLGDLAELETETAWYIDELGRKIYLPGTDFTGEISRKQYLDYMLGQLPKNPKGEDAVQAVKNAEQAILGNVPELPPGSDMVSAGYYGASDELRLIDLAKEKVKAGMFELPPAELATKAVDFDAWEPVFQRMLGVYNETHAMAAGVARRTRDRVLLDYNDRRTTDTLMKVIYPWGYWHSRSIPNWGKALVLNPAMTAHYMHLKDELREYNNQDPTIPEWAKDKIALRPPGYPGNLHWDLDASFNAVGQIFDNFDDPDQQKDALGRAIQTFSMAGPAPHPMFMAAYAAERYFLQGDTEAARSYGYLAPATRGFAAITGTVLEPWLWNVDPTTGKREVGVGGTKWDIAKATRRLGYEESLGQVTPEQSILAGATRSGKVFEGTLDWVMKYRRVPAMASWLLGLRVTPRDDWEREVGDLGAQYGELKRAGKTQEAKQLIDDNPWLSTVWMAYDNDAERMTSLAKSVFSRLPPGANSEALLSKAGITPLMRDVFYDAGDLSGWEHLDYEQFARGVMNLAEILQVPDKKTSKEWREARQKRSELYKEAEELFPGVQEAQNTYFTIQKTQGKEQADQYAEQSGLYEYWNWLNKSLIEDDTLLKYYAEPGDVDSVSRSMVYDVAENKWPGVHKVQDGFFQIPEDDKRARKQYILEHPELEQYWNEKAQLEKDLRTQLKEKRERAGTGQAAPGTIDYIIDGKPNLTQRAVLEQIKEENMVAELPVAPPPAIKESDPNQQAFYLASNQAARDAQQLFPEAATWEAEYDRIKGLHGEDAAKLYAKSTGLYDYWTEVRFNKTKYPETLVALDGKDLEYAAKDLAKREAYQRWEGLQQKLDGYYAIPGKKERRVYLDDTAPELREYWGWRDGAEQYYLQALQEQQQQAKGMTAQPKENDLTELDKLREAIGGAESGNNYAAQNKKSTASGRYQYIDSTWGGYEGYNRAADAPPEVQDAKMMEDLQKRFAQYGGDIDKVIVAHYYPAWANNSEKWGQSPTPGQPTIREYIASVKKKMEAK